MKTLKKHLAVMITIFLIAAMWPVTVYASIDEDNVAEEIRDVAETAEPEVEAAIPEDPSDLHTGESSETAAEAIEEEVPENVVGADAITVGVGVTATFDETAGAVEFYSDGGTLWENWIEQSGIDKALIKSIRVSSGKVYLPKDSARIFCVNYYDQDTWRYTSNLKEIDLSGFDTTNVEDMSSMFYGCSSLATLDLSRFDTSKVKNMSYMFRDCSGLTTLDLSRFGTSNVEKMQYMFENCSGLKSLKIGSFDTSNVENMSSMFRGCSNLSSLDVSCFATSNVTDMSNMFADCSKLTTLEISHFDTSNVTSTAAMFFNCSGLEGLDVSHFNTEKVIWMGSMFYGCSGLKQLDVIHFNTSNVKEMEGLFSNCSGLTALNVSKFDTSNVTQMGNMFHGCSGLTELDCHSFDTANLTNMYGMFSGCTGLKTLNISSFDTSKVTNMTSLFSNCCSLTRLDLSNFNISSVYNMDYMFYDCSALEYLNLSSYDMTNVRYCTSLFGLRYGRSSALQILETPKANTHKVELPVTMCDESGNSYTSLPLLTKSITLRRKTVPVTPTPTPTPTPTSGQTITGFSDVQDPTHPYYNAIYWAADAGITKGYPDGSFGIDKSCTRGEMIMFLWRFAGKPTPKTVAKSPFKDVPKTHTFYKAVLWAYQKGITKGYGDGTFGVNRNVSRGECMMFLWRVKGKPTPKTVSKSPFKDVPKTHVFYNAILWGSQKGITKGYGNGTFGVNDDCTRGQIVTFLYRAK